MKSSISSSTVGIASSSVPPPGNKGRRRWAFASSVCTMAMCVALYHGNGLRGGPLLRKGLQEDGGTAADRGFFSASAHLRAALLKSESFKKKEGSDKTTSVFTEKAGDEQPSIFRTIKKYTALLVPKKFTEGNGREEDNEHDFSPLVLRAIEKHNALDQEQELNGGDEKASLSTTGEQGEETTHPLLRSIKKNYAVVTPTTPRRYVTYAPSGGLTNQLMALQFATQIAQKTGRTLILPPLVGTHVDIAQDFYEVGDVPPKWALPVDSCGPNYEEFPTISWDRVLDLEDLAQRVDVMTKMPSSGPLTEQSLCQFNKLNTVWTLDDLVTGEHCHQGYVPRFALQSGAKKRIRSIDCVYSATKDVELLRFGFIFQHSAISPRFKFSKKIRDAAEDAIDVIRSTSGELGEGRYLCSQLRLAGSSWDTDSHFEHERGKNLYIANDLLHREDAGVTMPLFVATDNDNIARLDPTLCRGGRKCFFASDFADIAEKHDLSHPQELAAMDYLTCSNADKLSVSEDSTFGFIIEQMYLARSEDEETAVLKPTTVAANSLPAEIGAHSEGRVALLRPFHVRDFKNLLQSFEEWKQHVPCLKRLQSPDEMYATASKVDLFLSISQQTTADILVELKNTVNAAKEDWVGCFRSLEIVDGRLGSEEDLYSTHGDSLMWVNGPNTHFRNVVESLRKRGVYETVLLLEPDTHPVVDGWLDLIIDEIEKERPFIVLGSKNLDPTKDAGLNGNAVYNVSHPIVGMMLNELETESSTEKNAIPYDVRVSQILTDVGFGSLLKETLLIENQWSKNFAIDELRETTALVHGKLMMEEWSPVQLNITLVVLERPEGDMESFFSSLRESKHPFSEVIVIRGPGQDVGASSGFEAEGIPVRSFPYVESAICEARVSNEWFLVVDSTHHLVPMVSLYFERDAAHRPVVPFVTAHDKRGSCMANTVCRETITDAQTIYTGANKIVSDKDMLFNRDHRDGFCSSTMLERRTKVPTATSYVAYLESIQEADLVYSFTDYVHHAKNLVFSDQGLQVQGQKLAAKWPPEDVVANVADEQNRIIILTVNCGNLDLLDNLVASLLRVGAENFLVVPLDETSSRVLHGVFPKHALPLPPYLKGVDSSQAAYGTPAFKALTQTRPGILRDFIKLGYHVLYSDVDTVWRNNVLDVMEDGLAEGTPAKIPTAAFVFDNDERKIGEICTCMLYMKACDDSLTLISEWQRVLSEDTTGEFIEDQKGFNRAVSNLVNDISFRIFSGDEGFPSGREYFDIFNTWQRSDAHVIHNNWVVGKNNKVQRFQQHGLWTPTGLLPSESYTCGTTSEVKQRGLGKGLSEYSMCESNSRMSENVGRNVSLVFVHVPKTGGSSIEYELETWTKQAGIFYGHANEYEQRKALLPTSPEIPGVYTGHQAFPWYLNSSPRKPQVTLVVMRDPIDRFISHFKHIMRWDHPNREKFQYYWGDRSFDDVVSEFNCDKVPETEQEILLFEVMHSQLLFICGLHDDCRYDIDNREENFARALYNLDNFDMVGVTESMDALVDQFHFHLDWVPQNTTTLTRNNVNEKKKLKKDGLETATLQKLNWCLREENILYRRAVELAGQKQATASKCNKKVHELEESGVHPSQYFARIDELSAVVSNDAGRRRAQASYGGPLDPLDPDLIISSPTSSPTLNAAPSGAPTSSPTLNVAPSGAPTSSPTLIGSSSPTVTVSGGPSPIPSQSPAPTVAPSSIPSQSPAPSETPTLSPKPSPTPSKVPSTSPSASPKPSSAPSKFPSASPSASPKPSPAPSTVPSFSPTTTLKPSLTPSTSPTVDPCNGYRFCSEFSVCVAVDVLGTLTATCECLSGFEEIDRVCVDINECAPLSPCEFSCVNMRGTFMCLDENGLPENKGN